jgi:hypothetical protein
MRAGKFLAMLAIAALAIGALGAAALAAKKKKTAVIFFNGSPAFKGIPAKKGTVTASGTLNTVNACESNRSMRLQVLDANGVVLPSNMGHSFLDASTSDSSGNWFLAGKLPKSVLPTGTNYVRVKAKKRTVGKFVCKAGVTPNVAIPTTQP